jgi:hypothetical protein
MTTAYSNKSDGTKVIIGRRYFSAAQAQRALVLVRRIAADIVGLYSHLLDLQEAFDATESAGRAGRERERARLEIVGTAQKLHSCLLELDDVGVELKDWEAGVVDFPCIAGGQEVRLCWQCGDERISHWHEIHACPAGRKLIETLPVADLPAYGTRLPRPLPAFGG